LLSNYFTQTEKQLTVPGPRVAWVSPLLAPFILHPPPSQTLTRSARLSSSEKRRWWRQPRSEVSLFICSISRVDNAPVLRGHPSSRVHICHVALMYDRVAPKTLCASATSLSHVGVAPRGGREREKHLVSWVFSLAYNPAAHRWQC
jgi:hypothetical protein